MKVLTRELRQGCDYLLARVVRHAECAQAMLNAKQLEAAFLFALLGFEELGKLIQLVDAAQAAEASQSAMAEVAGFFSHANKAAHSAKNITLAFDLLIPPLRDAGLDTSSMSEYVTHLAWVKEHFERLREGMMYVDFREGSWTLEEAPRWDLIYMDINVLQLAAMLIWANLQKSSDQSLRSFVNEFNKAVEEFKEGFSQFIDEMKKLAAQIGKNAQP